MRRVSTFLWLALLGACRMGFDDVAATSSPDASGGDASTTARITVQRNGPGLGTVVGPNGFSCASASCTFEVDKGTTVTLRGLAATNAWFEGWTNLCGGNFECAFDAQNDATIIADFTATPNRVFI